MPGSIADTAREIQRYCASHPNAMDTLDGIVWWVTRQRLQETREQVEQAVNLLVAQGVLVPHVLADGTCAFRHFRSPAAGTRSC